mgnify:CR=1 FL=1|jgi:thiol-disulfide isomerase/thioredoxin
MSSQINTMSEKITKTFSSKKFIIILILLAMFIGAAFYVYNTYVAPKLNPSFISNREFVNKGGQQNTSSAEIYFIFAKWCPYSKKVMPIWETLKEKYDRKVVKNMPVIFKELDGDSQEKEIDLFSKNFNKKIDGYPTIILVKENDVIEFDAEPTKDNLEAFINSTL